MFRRRTSTTPNNANNDSRQQQQLLHSQQELLLVKLEQYLLKQQHQHRSTHNSTQQSLTLPAAALGWLTQVYFRQEDTEDTDVDSRRRKRLIRSLVVQKLTHLRITPDPWPSSVTTSSTYSNRNVAMDDDEHNISVAALSRNLHLDGIEHLHVLWLDRVPLDWVVTFPENLRILRVENACIYDLSSVLLPASLTHVKLEHCCLGERSGLRPKRIIVKSTIDTSNANQDLLKQNIQQKHEQLSPPIGGHDDDDDDDDVLKPPAKMNVMSSTTPPFALLPNLRSLNLAHNEIHTEATALAGVDQRRYQHHFLSKIDLSYNFLRALPRAHLRFSETLQTLILSYNQIQSVAGIDRIGSLRILYLDHNQIHDLHSTANALACLPHLQELYLEGNPLQYLETVSSSLTARTSRYSNKKNPAYRVDVLNAFRERRLSELAVAQLRSLSMRDVQQLLPKLDGEQANLAELKGLRARTFVPVVLAAVEAASRQSGSIRTIRQGSLPENDENTARIEEDCASHVFVPSIISTRATNHNYRKRRRRKIRVLSTNNEETDYYYLKETTTTLYHPPVVSFTLSDIFAVSSTPTQQCHDGEDVNIGECQVNTTQNEDIQVKSNRNSEDVNFRSSIDYEENIGVKYLMAATQRLQNENTSGLEGISSRIRQKYIPSDDYDNVHKKEIAMASSQSSHDHFDEVTLPITNKTTKGSYVSASSSTSSSISRKNKKAGLESPSFVSGDDDLHGENDAWPLQYHVAQHDDLPNTELGNLSLSAITREEDEEETLNDTNPLSASTELSATTADTNPQTPSSDDFHGTSIKLPMQQPTTQLVKQTGKTSKQSLSPGKSSDGSSHPSSSNQLSTMSPEESTTPAQFPLRISSFSENHWVDDGNSDNNSGVGSSAPSFSFGAFSAASRPETPASKKEAFKLAESKSVYHGPGTYRNMLISENLELYFQLFVFAASTMPEACLTLYGSDSGIDESCYEAWRDVLLRYPRIQLWQVDIEERDTSNSDCGKEKPIGIQLLQESKEREFLVRVWKEKVVACGKAALRRLTPNRGARYGFHGELLWSAAESSHMMPEIVIDCRETICCFSNTSFYIIADHDIVSSKFKDRTFPRPIPKDGRFKDAMWPHALACHQFKRLQKIVIGFEFQRLTLHFDDPTSSYKTAIYILLTCNKMETVDLLKTIQELTLKAKEDLITSSVVDSTAVVQIENDDATVLESLTAAVAPERLDVVRHYQILQQQWKHGNRGTVRRVCVLTESKIFLLDEDYLGDGSDKLENNKTTQLLGKSIHRLVDSAEINQIVEVQAAAADPCSITIVINPSSKLKKTRNWRLVCRDGRGAEKLVEDVRKAMIGEKGR